MKLIQREYLQKLINTIGTPDIKVITGVRRSGKSKLMEQFIEYVRENCKDANVIHINFSLIEFEELQDYKSINCLHAEELFDIYLTGSNAFLLSSDLATLFTGRCFEIAVYPFSFSEYLKYFESENIMSDFDKYYVDGGMAGSYLYQNEDLKLDYVRDVYNDYRARLNKA